MGIKTIFNSLRKGVNAGIMAVKHNDTLTDQRLISIINDFKRSEKRKWMGVGAKYYRAESDILNRRMYKTVSGRQIEETYKANNKIAHAKYKNLVDEKIAYLLANDYTLKNDDTGYIEKIKLLLGKSFSYRLSQLGYESSNKGVGWLQIYIDAHGQFKTMVIPAEQCCPIWTDSTHTELSDMIRVYATSEWEFGRRKTVEHIEHWTVDGVSYYTLSHHFLTPDVVKNYEDNAPVAHYKKNGEWAAWGRVPFVAFKNNMLELPDIRFIKTLIDAYDIGRSEAANYVEEVKNLIYVLKGYGGEDLDQFMRDLNERRVVSLDPDENAGLSALTPTMDITAIREHYEQLKRDILEDGQGANKDLDKFGSAPSGVALKFMYAGLDLKCNAMETEYKQAFEQLGYFMDRYLLDTGQGDYTANDMEIIFNRNMQIDETERIANCISSQGVVSEKTILGKHPWVKDIEQEQKWLEDEKGKNEPEWNKVPLGVDDEGQPVLGKENRGQDMENVQ